MDIMWYEDPHQEFTPDEFTKTFNHISFSLYKITNNLIKEGIITKYFDEDGHAYYSLNKDV